MNKARKKTYKQGVAKRLVRESLVLSSTRFVSSRAVRFFETGLGAPLLNSVKTVDRFVRKKITYPLFKKVELRKNFAMPVRNSIASFLANNPVLKRISATINAVLNTSLRSVGIFLLTFGVYAAAIFSLKRFVSLTLGEANPDDLIFSAITVLVGLLLTCFGDKSVLTSLGGGRIVGSLLSDCLGVNDSTLNRITTKTSSASVGISFLLGSLTGVLTLFLPPSTIMMYLALGILCIAVMHIPEFGLLLSVATVSFVSLDFTAMLSSLTLVSYFVKCLRLKRNFRFGTADAIVLLMAIVQFITFAVSGGGFSDGEHYVLIFTGLYFAVRNIICSEKLIDQAFNSLCAGLSLGMSLYLLRELSSFIPHAQLRSAAMMLSSQVMSPAMMAVLISSTLPFAFASFSNRNTKRRELSLLLLAIACAVVTDSFLMYALVSVSLFVYIAAAYKAPFGALLGAAVSLTPAFLIFKDFTVSSAVTGNSFLSFDSALALPSEITSSNFWLGMNEIGSLLSVILLFAALVLIFQRIFGCSIANSSERIVLICGTVGASALMITACGFIFNLFADLRVLVFVWFIFGLCGSVYKVYKNYQNTNREV